MRGLFRVVVVLFIVLQACDWCAAQQPYFPANAFGTGQWAQSESSLNAYFLSRLEEPSLFDKAKSRSNEAYRFLWLRTFHNPIAVRLEAQPDGTSLLTIKVADGHSGFPRTVTKLSQSTSRTVSREDTDAFRDKVRAVAFWKAGSRDPGAPAATDCDGWILEGVTNGRYHVVARAIPNTLPKKAKLVQDLGLMLAIEIGRLAIPEDER